MKTLVTGATGFVGTKMTKALLDLGHDIRILSRSGRAPEELSQSDIEVIKGDVSDFDSVLNATSGCRFVFHLAGLVGYSRAMRPTMVEANTNGTSNILQACRKYEIEKLFYMSSVVAIGASFSPDDILSETSEYNIKRLDLGYFETKHDAEELVKRAVKAGEVNAVIANPSTIYGKGDAKKGSRRSQIKVAQGKMPFYTNGGVNVVHIDDCIEGCLRIFEKGRAGERYILSGENMTIENLFFTIADCAGVRRPFIRLPNSVVHALGRWGDLKEKFGGKGMISSENAWTSTIYHWFSNEKARRELGFNPRPARDAIGESVGWMKEYGYI